MADPGVNKFIRLLLTALSLLTITNTHPVFPPAFPPVNLGYATHVPTYINTTSTGLRYANYNNIRFAYPPLGPLRFRRPRTPPPKQDGWQDGAALPFSTDCVSAVPNIFGDIGTPVRAWGQEDCLFLNVRVPEGVKEGDNVPVLHWVHGSGYVYGSKDRKEIVGDGAGLFEEMSLKEQKFIYVASNYRMGLYGWSSSPEEDMDANVGLHDTMAALQWTQKYISKFGGDPRRITAFGQSAGAGMINLLMAAKNGREDLPFSRAFIASPCVWPRKDPGRRQSVFEVVLKATDCSSVACVRDASEQDLFNANSYLVVNASDGKSGTLGPGSGFAPFVDGDYITDLLPALLTKGRHNRKVKAVVASNMANEGMTQSPPAEVMPGAFPDFVRGTIPGASDETVERITALYRYPPDHPEKLGWAWATDVVFACNAHFTAKVYKNRAQRYVMSIPPASHGLDQGYWFYQNDQITPVANTTVARQFQEYVRRFVTGGKNREVYPDLAGWPRYGPKEAMFDVTVDGFEREKDYWEVHRRCQVLNEIFNDPKNSA